MAQTIGTNIVTDEQDILSFIQKLLDEAEKIQDNHGLSKEKKNLKALMDHIGAGKDVYINNFTKSDAKLIKDILDAKKIPYTILPSKVGDEELEAILVRDIDVEDFLAAQDLAFVQNGRIYRELDIDNMINNIKTEPVYDGMRTPIFEFKNSKIRAIFLEELAKNDVPYGFDDKTGKVVIYPNQAFKDNRNDLATSIFNMAVKYSVFYKFPAYRDYQETLANANNEAIQDFLNKCDSPSTSSIIKLENLTETKGIFYNVHTKTFTFEDRSQAENSKCIDIPISPDMSNTQKFTLLSKYAAEVVRKQESPILVPDASDTCNLLAGNVDFNKITESQKVFLMTAGPVLGIGDHKQDNPFYREEISKAMSAEDNILKNLDKIKHEADQYVKGNFPYAKADEKCMRELEYITKALKRSGVPGYSEQLAKDIIENLDGSIKNGTGDFGWAFIDKKDIEEYLQKENDYSKDHDTEHDRDNTLEDEKLDGPEIGQSE